MQNVLKTHMNDILRFRAPPLTVSINIIILCVLYLKNFLKIMFFSFFGLVMGGLLQQFFIYSSATRQGKQLLCTSLLLFFGGIKCCKVPVHAYQFLIWFYCPLAGSPSPFTQV